MRLPRPFDSDRHHAASVIERFRDGLERLPIATMKRNRAPTSTHSHHIWSIAWPCSIGHSSWPNVTHSNHCRPLRRCLASVEFDARWFHLDQLVRENSTRFPTECLPLCCRAVDSSILWPSIYTAKMHFSAFHLVCRAILTGAVFGSDSWNQWEFLSMRWSDSNPNVLVLPYSAFTSDGAMPPCFAFTNVDIFLDSLGMFEYLKINLRKKLNRTNEKCTENDLRAPSWTHCKQNQERRKSR